MAFDKRGALVGATLLVVLIALVAFGRRPTLVAWHKWRMEVAHRRINEVGAFSNKQSAYIESHDYHRQWLVDLGYLQHRKFTLRYVKTATPEYSQLWELAVNLFPRTDYDGLASDWDDQPTPMVLEVWDRPENMPRWEQFVREHDVPDFAQRFGLEPEAGSAGR